MEPDALVVQLLERCRRDHRAWINGDAGGYAFEADADTIFGGFGGIGVGGSRITPGQQRATAQFEAGSGEIELLRAGVSGDVAWLVMVERNRSVRRTRRAASLGIAGDRDLRARRRRVAADASPC